MILKNLGDLIFPGLKWDFGRFGRFGEILHISYLTCGEFLMPHENAARAAAKVLQISLYPKFMEIIQKRTPI